jgi:hypothetical protein
MDPFFAKTIVLCFCSVGGMLCCFLGYRLYVLGVIEKGKVDASGAGVKLALQDYGPGVVFALFGMAVIAVCATRTFTRTTETPVATQSGGSLLPHVGRPQMSVPATASGPDPASSKVVIEQAVHPLTARDTATAAQ